MGLCYYRFDIDRVFYLNTKKNLKELGGCEQILTMLPKFSSLVSIMRDSNRSTQSTVHYIATYKCPGIPDGSEIDAEVEYTKNIFIKLDGSLGEYEFTSKVHIKKIDTGTSASPGAAANATLPSGGLGSPNQPAQPSVNAPLNYGQFGGGGGRAAGIILPKGYSVADPSFLAGGYVPTVVEDYIPTGVYDPAKAPCYHQWKAYVGFSEAYDYCDKCGDKK